MIETISFPCKKFRVFVRCHLQPDSRLPDTNLLFNLSIFSFNASNSRMYVRCRRNWANPQLDRRTMRIITQPWQTQWPAVCGILHGCKHRYDFKQMLFSGSRPAGQPADWRFRAYSPACSWSDNFAGRRDTHSCLTRTAIDTHARTMRCVAVHAFYSIPPGQRPTRSQWALMENIFLRSRF